MELAKLQRSPLLGRTPVYFYAIALSFPNIMSTQRNDQDSPWKTILRQYFPEAIEFFFPATAKLIDWSKPIEFLETELQFALSIGL
jgi:hypothetical protein